MGKQKLKDADFDIPESSFNASTAVAKLPTDVRGGKEALNDFMNLPVESLVPFSLKEGSDFSRPRGRFYERFLESIREVGVIEVITVRVKSDAFYEILAGETRWTAAKEVGLRVVPCRIIEADDAKARKIFSWTNLLRRDLTVRDRINGWWQYYMSAKDAGELSLLRENTRDDGLSQYASSNERLRYRQIMYYVKMHNLTSEWIDLLEEDPDTGKPNVTIRVGIEVAKFDANKQMDLFPYAARLNEHLVSQLLSLDKGELKDEKGEPFSWNEDNILKIIEGKPLNGDEENAASMDASALKLIRLKPGIMKIAKRYLRPEDYGKAPEIIQEALEMYYKAKEQA